MTDPPKPQSDLAARARKRAEDFREARYMNDAGRIFLCEASQSDADLLTALADRVDEQAKRIAELEGENDRLRKSFAREVRRADCFGMERFMLAMLCADTPYLKDEQSIAAAKKVRDEVLKALSQKGGE